MRLSLLAAVLVLTGCGGDGGSTPADGGQRDSGRRDSSVTPDGSTTDSGPRDSGFADDGGEEADAGPTDAGETPDSGDTDGGSTADSGPADAGAADAGPTEIVTLVWNGDGVGMTTDSEGMHHGWSGAGGNPWAVAMAPGRGNYLSWNVVNTIEIVPGIVENFANAARVWGGWGGPETTISSARALRFTVRVDNAEALNWFEVRLRRDRGEMDGNAVRVITAGVGAGATLEDGAWHTIELPLRGGDTPLIPAEGDFSTVDQFVVQIDKVSATAGDVRIDIDDLAFVSDP